MRKSIFFIVALCAMVILGSFQLAGQDQKSREMEVGTPMPEFVFNSDVHGELSSADMKGEVVLMTFFATWCGPCQIMKPRILDVAERIGDDAKVIQIDIDKEKELATRFRIQSVPTLIIFKNGKQQWRQSGVISAHALMQLLKEYQ